MAPGRPGSTRAPRHACRHRAAAAAARRAAPVAGRAGVAGRTTAPGRRRQERHRSVRRRRTPPATPLPRPRRRPHAGPAPGLRRGSRRRTTRPAGRGQAGRQTEASRPGRDVRSGRCHASDARSGISRPNSRRTSRTCGRPTRRCGQLGPDTPDGAGDVVPNWQTGSRGAQPRTNRGADARAAIRGTARRRRDTSRRAQSRPSAHRSGALDNSATAQAISRSADSEPRGGAGSAPSRAPPRHRAAPARRARRSPRPPPTPAAA